MIWQPNKRCFGAEDKIAIVYFYALLFFCHATVFCQDWYQQLNLPKANSWQAITFFTFIGILIAAVVLLEIQRKIKSAIETSTALKDQFQENVVQFDLTDEEIQRVKILKNYLPKERQNEFFTSISAFEECIDRDVQHLLQISISEVQKREEEALLFSIRKKLKFSYPDALSTLFSSRNISLGQQVSLFEPGQRDPIIKSGKVNSNQEFSLRVEYSPATESPIVFAHNAILNITFARNNDAVYTIPATVLASSSSGWIEFLHSLDMRRTQIRKDVRIEVSLPMKYRITRSVDPVEMKKNDNTLYPGRIVDISGGGLSFVGYVSRKQGDILAMNMQLPEITLTGMQGKVLRISTQNGKTGQLFKHHIQFINLDQTQRERIIKFIFEKLRLQSQWR